MTTATQDHALTVEEWRLVCALRGVPSGALRYALTEVLDELVERVKEPRCAEYQADGAACPTLDVACEKCQQVGGMLSDIKTRLLPRRITR
jgi:hypothetical protein